MIAFRFMSRMCSHRYRAPNHSRSLPDLMIMKDAVDRRRLHDALRQRELASSTCTGCYCEATSSTVLGSSVQDHVDVHAVIDPKVGDQYDAQARQAVVNSEEGNKDPVSHNQPESELMAILALRRAATTHENYPQETKSARAHAVQAIAEVEAKAELPSGAGNAAYNAASRAVAGSEQRFDFGIGVSRCSVCDSRISRLNRGCGTCKLRMCCTCFREHSCVLESVREADTDHLRSTPGIAV